MLAVSDAAYKQQQRLAKKFDNVRATLDKQIAHFEQELSQPLESRASVGISGEIRKFVKDMTTEERHKFIQEAIDAGDHTTVSAVLGAPATCRVSMPTSPRPTPASGTSALPRKWRRSSRRCVTQRRLSKNAVRCCSKRSRKRWAPLGARCRSFVKVTTKRWPPSSSASNAADTCNQQETIK